MSAVRDFLLIFPIDSIFRTFFWFIYYYFLFSFFFFLPFYRHYLCSSSIKQNGEHTQTETRIHKKKWNKQIKMLVTKQLGNYLHAARNQTFNAIRLETKSSRILPLTYGTKYDMT